MKSNELIRKRMEELGLKRQHLAKELGYKNLNKGMLVVDDYLLNGVIDIQVITPLSKALQVSENEIIESMLDTSKIYEAEEIIDYENKVNNFEPYGYAMVRRKTPRHLLGIGLAEKQRYIKFNKDILEMSELNQLEIIKKEIQIHFDKQQGKVENWGDITRYAFYNHYVISPETTMIFDTNGDRIINPENVNLYHLNYLQFNSRVNTNLQKLKILQNKLNALLQDN